VLAVTSRWEGSPLTTLEAMRAGRAVVAYDVGGLAEQIEDGKTGFLIRSGDVRQMIGRLAQLSADPALTAEMGDAGRRMFESRFTLDRMLAGSERVYRHHLGVTETAW
jgi:glycosyltransferase involved in cell wall biosynthesis